MSKSKPRGPKRVKTIPIEQIRFLNPRVRNRRNFQEIVQSIANVGLKRPITVSPRKSEADSASYDLVCGQGRVEAFIQLGQTEIPAIVIEAEEADCLVMSLVENCARRQHRAIDLLQDISTLRGRGYTDREIAPKLGVSFDIHPYDRQPFGKGRGKTRHRSRSRHFAAEHGYRDLKIKR